ncbi:MAG TPA: AraC family transcriptional regulator, partial [Burkholderiales bacterium]|nr:AraC family transcriptional regulator [Burkholderiales bacterium]
MLLPEVVLLDLAGPADAFRNAASRTPGSYRLRFAAPQRSLASAGGLQLSGLEPLPARLTPDT